MVHFNGETPPPPSFHPPPPRRKKRCCFAAIYFLGTMGFSVNFPPLENTICPLGGGAWNQKSFLHFDISISYFSLATQKLKWPKEIFEAPSVHLSGTYLFPTVSEQRSAFSIQDFFAPPKKENGPNRFQRSWGLHPQGVDSLHISSYRSNHSAFRLESNR